MPMASVESPSIQRFPSALLVGALVAAFAATSCGDEKKDEGTVDSAGTKVVEVCGAQLTCGDVCVADTSCPSGQFCDDDGKCYAECTEDVGCMGECMANGRCAGERQIVVDGPNNSDNGPLLVGDDDTSAPISGGDGTSFEGCATDSASGQLTPVALYVMFDRSSSMEGQKWMQATTALRAFYQDPASADLNIAHAVFPSEVNGCNDPVCDVGACAAPVVAIGKLTAEAAPNDAQEAALVAAIDNDQPGDGSGRTPTYPALAGSLQWAEGYQAQNPSSAAVVVLVTDGEATGCSTTDTGSIAGLAADSLASAGVRTYVIGLEGSSENQIDQIAAAGGTGEGIFIGGGGDAGQQLLDALGQIRGDVASCDLQMPKPASGVVDPAKVNVELTLSGGAVSLAQVAGADDCEDVAGWYYNNNNTPTRIQLCPATCDAVQRDAMSRIDIVLGCATNMVPPTLAR